ncbi:methyl-accepting chemotaxis protein [Caulobacter sp. CCG-8]|uniref:methyl-accepting chemotaxis protein n=1 Tax=Caulobacter sp. CCG-8 TaxID=3127958 RepID=UPI00307EB882
MGLDDLKISTKVLLPAAVLAVAVLGCTGMGVWQQKSLQDATRILVEHRSPAEVQSARFSRRLSMMGHAAHRVVTYEGTSEAAQSASKELDKVYAEGKDSLDKMVKADPAIAPVADGFRQRIDALYADGRAAADLGLANDDTGAIARLSALDPAIESLSKDAKAWGDGYHVETDALVATANKKANQGALTTMVLGLVAALGGMGLALWIGSRKISRPLASLSRSMTTLAQGEVDVEVAGAGRKDEVGLMARAVQVFKDNAVALRTSEAEQQRISAASEDERRRNEAASQGAADDQAFVMERIAAGLARLSRGDLTVRVVDQFPEGYGQLRTDFNGAMEHLDQAMGQILTAVGGIGRSSDEITAAADNTARRSEQQAASLEETAAALDEITATVRRASQGANDAARVVGSTREDAERSGDVVRDAVAAMNGIEQSSQQIGQIIGVIDEIAFQTNLLALNAGVEAARAGDAGRGFAVVAQEVRALAQRSAEAAKEIKTLISTSAGQVGQGVKLVGQTGEALEGIVFKVGEIDALVKELAASAGEQATSLHEVNSAVNQMDQGVQQNAAMIEQATAVSHALKTEIGGLVQMMSRFQVSGGSASAQPMRRAG